MRATSALLSKHRGTRNATWLPGSARRPYLREKLLRKGRRREPTAHAGDERTALQASRDTQRDLVTRERSASASARKTSEEGSPTRTDRACGRRAHCSPSIEGHATRPGYQGALGVRICAKNF